MTLSKTALLAAAIIAVGITYAPLIADAAERNQSGSFTRNNGETTNWQRNVEKNKGSSERNLTWENKNGDGSSSAARSWDRDNGTAGGSRSTTNAQGQNATTSWSGHRTDNGIQSSGQRTGFNGKTTSYDANTVRNEDGSRTTTRTYTNEDGQSKTKTVTRGLNE